ncbi:MAG: hypothetical protein HYZ43_07330 [Flavobacteriia bacterium]|nr:hypothetical protein [Flavobacteriia bacterium]
MKTTSFTFVLKTVLLFALIAILIDVCRNLIYLRFNMAQFFQTDILLYEVLLEYIFVFVTGLTTYFVTKRIRSTELGASLIIALAYSLIYSAISLMVYKIIVSISGATMDFKVDVYSSFLRFIPNAFYVGILYVLVWRIKFKKLEQSTVE